MKNQCAKTLALLEIIPLNVGDHATLY